MILLNYLVSQNIISNLDSKKIEEELKQDPNLLVDDILIKYSVPEVALLTARNATYNIPVYVNQEDFVDNNLYNLINKEKSEKYLAIPLGYKNKIEETDKKTLLQNEKNKKQEEYIENKNIDHNYEVLIGIVDPERKNVLEALQFFLTSSGVSYKIFLISLNEYRNRFKKYPEETNIVKKEEFEEKENVSDITDEPDLLEEDLIESMSMLKILNIILKNSISSGSSDIHIENVGNHTRIRIRIDGVLENRFNLPSDKHSAIVARIKILCQMRLDEKRKPQDGRFSVFYNSHKVDFRVSTMPAYYGEKVVVRILDSYRGVRKLSEVGLSNIHLSQIKKALEKPFGIILISGPTGSGKTTTLYSMLGEIDKEKRNVISLEDPIEYNMPSINQSQIFPEIGYTFASGLRSILRQDPDVITVGEIRDGETAGLAIQAALTGHLVFSTIHTNNAVGVITRLIDMGVDSFLIAPTLNLAISQRLVRKIADDCVIKEENESLKTAFFKNFDSLDEKFKKDLPLDKDLYTFSTNSTNSSGLKGRLPVFEILEIDNDISQLISNKASEDEIFKEARKKGMITIKEDAILKCLDGKIPWQEINTL